MSEIMAHFSCLDELVQVIYQSIYKFVVLSTVSDDKWNVFLGLASPKGRWWHGFWTEEDIIQKFGSKSSDKLLESFAEKLAELFIQGDVCVTDWNTEKCAHIKFTLGPASKKPMHVSLVEMTPEDAASHATNVFLDIALNAQSRKCRLYPSSVDYPAYSSADTSLPPASVVAGPSKRKERSPEPQSRRSTERSDRNSSDVTQHIAQDKAAREEIKSLKSQLQQVKRPGSQAEKPAPPVVRTHKGSSLANPNKKARKYQAIEFESDDE